MDIVKYISYGLLLGILSMIIIEITSKNKENFESEIEKVEEYEDVYK